MTKYFVLFILCVCSIIKANAQKKYWETIVFSRRAKDKGVLKEVNDSSLVLLTKNGEQRLLYTDITRLNFIRGKNRTIQVMSGIIVGTSLGAAITARQASKGREGEPAALSGVVGGIGGGILGGIVGGFTAPLLCHLLFGRKIEIEHSTIFYQSLHRKLEAYMAK